MANLAPSPMMVSLVQAAAQLPVLLLALPAGAWADLMDRKRLLILTNMLMLGASAALAIVAALERVDATVLLLFTALLAVGAALNNPAWAASVPLTVPGRSLAQAVVLKSVGFNIARAVGPAVAGLILTVAGATVAFATDHHSLDLRHELSTIPAIGWRWGYPFAIMLMIGAAIGSYVFFRWKKWL